MGSGYNPLNQDQQFVDAVRGLLGLPPLYFPESRHYGMKSWERAWGEAEARNWRDGRLKATVGASP